ncbi:TPA: IS3 family transposase [Legionella anisa]|uniref:IS3 family transposase n=1 Tax=Legionella anisa TaxID=28082 RepID=UPI00197FA8C2|nr:IS3 family transposase [Legionella anisa]MBN5937226.1 hypothetical protein [Legionella anisa]
MKSQEKLYSYGVYIKQIKDAQLALLDYIEVFYNRQRIHSALGFQTSNDCGMIA